MKKKFLVTIITAIIIVLMIPLGWAYYEYIGQYRVLLNGDGTINQNAFGVLNGDEYRDPKYNYGTSPENPFVIDNLDRLYNLLKLNNSGRLEKSKHSDGVYNIGQYYFVLNFTNEELPQVLDLEGITIESVGNNDYPFYDKLSGLLYAYGYIDPEDEQKKYILISGLIKPVKVTIENSKVYIDGVETNISAGTATAGEYIKIPGMYLKYMGDDGIRDLNENMYVPKNSLLEVRNVIANAEVKVEDEQIDVGFFSHISTKSVTMQGASEAVEVRGGVHDFILHNVTINCLETSENAVWEAIKTVWASLFGKHNREKEYTGDENGYYERHIGLFAGHLDGDVSNITVSGNGKILIDSKDVNYYSVFTTVGYIHGTAKIGTSTFESLLGTDISAVDGIGVMFADEIYAAGDEGDTPIPIREINKSGTWGGAIETDNGGYYFKYGAFRFILSDNRDTVGKIWSDGNSVKLLNAEGYIASNSVLYCNDEYRYSVTSKPGGSLISSPASVNETRYQGLHSLVASGSMLDKGNYVIAAKVPDGTGFKYYALKIEAQVVDGDTVVHRFDTSEKHIITDYILGNTNDIYSSAIWQTKADSATPKFTNMRFTNESLSVIVSGVSVIKSLTQNPSQAAEFSYNVLENTFYYKTTEETDEGIISVYYYLCYSESNGFYFDTNKGVDIVMYRLSNGFTLELVENAADILENEDYIIVARSGGTSYLLGEAIDEESDTVIAKGEFDYDLMLNPLPEKWSLQDYQDNRQYIWYSATAQNGVVTFYDKLSGRYYLANDSGSLYMSPVPQSWTYTQSSGEGGTLRNNSLYLSFSPSMNGTGFTLSDTQYKIYLYRLNADEDDMSFNTYQGAKLVTSESSSVEEGTYLIAAGNGKGLVMSGTGTLGVADLSGYITGSGSKNDLSATTGTIAGYKWQVGATSSKPLLKNIGYGSYLARSSDYSLTASSSPSEWLYDAASKRLYFTVKTTEGNTVTAVTYYLAYNPDGSGSFIITQGQDTQGLDYNITLYKLTYEYVYQDVKAVTGITENDTVFGSQTKIYFITTHSMTSMGTNANYVLGAKGTQNESAVESVNISPKSTYNSSTYTLTTTIDLSHYSWYLEPRILPEYGTRNIYTVTNYSYFPAFQLRNSATHMYLAASSAANSRTLVVATTPNMNKSPASGSQQAENNAGAMTAVGFGRGNAGQNSSGRLNHQDGTASIYIMGRSVNFEYYIWKTTTPGVFALSTYSSYPSGYSRPYFYQSSGYTINVYVSPVSEKGDNLDAGIHYMITAAVNDSTGKTQYYALSQTRDENGDKKMTGVNVTSQAETINTSYITDEFGNIIEESSTDSLRMVPVFSDWYQVSTEKGLRFYHSYYSTNANKEYLSVADGVPAFENIPVSSSAQPAEWYYDAISKYLKYYVTDGSYEFCYYLCYNPSSDSFYFTDDIGQATHFYIYRFKPTYVITQVTDGSGESLKSGNFIVAYGSSDKEFMAIGMNETDVISKNITEYLTDAVGNYRNNLTETEYLEILNYIFKQQYYDFSGESYNQSSPYLQLFSYVIGGGFTVAHDFDDSTSTTVNTGLQLGSNPMSWNLTRNSNGLWTFKNRYANSNDAAGTHGIYYTGSPSSYIRIADGTPFSLDVSSNSLTAKLYTYSNNTLSLATSLSTSSSNQYAIVLSSGDGVYYILRYVDGDFVPQAISVTLSGQNLQLSSSIDSSYTFRAYKKSKKSENYELRSRTGENPVSIYYEDGDFSASLTDPAYIWGVNKSGVLSSEGTAVSLTNLKASQGTVLNAVIYMYKKSGSTYIPLTGELEAGTNYTVVICRNSTYYLLGHSGSLATLKQIGTSKPIALSDLDVSESEKLTSVDGTYGVYLGFENSGMYLTVDVSRKFYLTSQKMTSWRYKDNVLYTVSASEIPMQYLSVNGSTVTFTNRLSAAWLYEVKENGSGYTLTRLESNMQLAGRNVVIVIASGSTNYAVTRNGSTITATAINTSGSNVTSNMIWHYDGNLFSFVDGATVKYLRRTTSGLTVGDDKDIDFFGSRYTTYSFTSPYSYNTNNVKSTPLYIFRIDQSEEIDEVTDINSLLGSKAPLTPTISLLESSKYIIVAEVGNDGSGNPEKYYSLGMIDINNTHAVDITDIMRFARLGSAVTVFDATVWEQRGNDIRLLFDNIAFGGSDNGAYYLLSGAQGIGRGMQPVVVKEEEFPDDLTAYEWRAYSDNDGYLFGFKKISGEEEKIYYLYFDVNERIFKLTSSKTVARVGGGVVRLYQLGAETVVQPEFLTPIIETEEGSDIIISYPINKVESINDIKQYSDNVLGKGNKGEYLIIAENGSSFHALTFSENGVISFVDVSFYFSGNYATDDSGNPCIAVNKRYVWLQKNSINPNLPLLSFENLAKGQILGSGNYYFTYDIENRQLSYNDGSGTKYLAYDAKTGYKLNSAESSNVKIYLYYLGTSGIDTGDKGTLNYTYYSIPLSYLPGGGIDFTRFEFLKKHMGELLNFAVGSGGQIEKSVGWNLADGKKLGEVTSSVFFTKGFSYDASSETAVSDFADDFAQMSNSYLYVDKVTGNSRPITYTYYAPAGSVALAVGEASKTNPIFLNVIVSTEFDNNQNFDENYLRYLGLWRIAEINNEDGTITALRTYSGSDGRSAVDFAHTLASKLNTPDFAIPLPHRYATQEKGASYAFVDGVGYELSDVIYDEYLIAHTFVITEPGLYYLGSNYGSVAISYVSIENLSEGETSGMTAGSQFTIDFCWGDIDYDAESVFNADNPNASLGDLAYVGSADWVHSNIFPRFTSDMEENLTDVLSMEVRRVLEDSENRISRVIVNTNTLMRIAGGVRYINGNNQIQRLRRRVTFNVFSDGLGTEEFSYLDYQIKPRYLWTATYDESGEGFRLYAFEVVRGQQQAFYLNVNSEEDSKPSLSVYGNLLWKLDEEGYLITSNGEYLCVDENGTLMLSETKSNAGIRLYNPDNLDLYTMPVDGGSYLMWSENYMVTIINPY